MKLELYYPTKPYRVNQVWGIYNPVYQQFGYTRHNGEDFALVAEALLRAPIDGVIVRTGNQPKGGGIFFGLMTGEYDFHDTKCRVLIDYLHCKELRVVEGQTVKTGEVLAVANNTGFSTGPHTHGQYRRAKNWNGASGLSLKWEEVDKNEANNSFDPTPHWTGFYAQDIGKVTAITEAIAALWASIVEYTKGR